jgi:hypothetical protein
MINMLKSLGFDESSISSFAMEDFDTLQKLTTSFKKGYSKWRPINSIELPVSVSARKEYLFHSIRMVRNPVTQLMVIDESVMKKVASKYRQISMNKVERWGFLNVVYRRREVE